MKKNFSKKLIVPVLSITLLSSTILPTFAQASTESNFSTVVRTADSIEKLKNKNRDKIDREIVADYDNIEVVDEDMEAMIKLKMLASIIRVGGFALEVILTPFSKKAANSVMKNRLKIADALDRVETYSTNVLVNAFKKAGIPTREAEDIAAIIIFIVL